MKVVKPNALGVLTRCFEYERRARFGVSVLAFVPLGDEPALLPEVAMWTFAAERLGSDAALEVGVPKSRGELLVHGSCFAPGGVPQPQLPVHVRVGPVERGLLVTGDRYWQPGGTPSEPQPFAQMPLDWSRSYGGPRFKRNPLGRGHGESEYMGQRVQLLPNVEDPDALVQAPRDRPEPAGLGPMDISWPQRQELAGTYDARWLETLSPGMTHDVDWRLFNLAQPAQQREGFWEGGEPYRFDNLHPQRPALEGQLPRLRARSFVGRRAEASDAEVRLEEVELSLRTLWLFPDAERAVLVYQGSTDITEPDGTDIGHLLIAAEHLDRPRPAEHYAEALASRLDEDHGVIAALREHELLPEGLGEAVDEAQARERALYQTERHLEHNLHRRAVAEHQRTEAELRARGIDPVEFGLEAPEPPPPQPSPDELPGLIEQLKAEAEERREAEEADAERRREQLAAKLEALGFDEAERERLLSQDAAGPTGPPTFTAEGQRRQLVALVEQARARGDDPAPLVQMLEDPALVGRWAQAEAELRENYRKHAHLQDPAPRMEPERSEQARGLVHQLVAQGQSLSSYDFTGADLSGADLRGADLRGALFESACFDGADLREARLDGSVLAHASLRKARLDGAALRKANLGGSVAHDASLTGVDLEDGELMRADLSRAVLRGASLNGVNLLQTNLTDVDATQVRAEQLMLVRLEAAGLRLGGSALPGAVFVELDLRRGDLSGAQLPGATFVDCDLREVSFAGSTLDNGRFVKGCRLDGASFVGAQLGMCNLRGSSMLGCDLSQATLDASDLSECLLDEAKLYRAVARGTRFDKAQLSDAMLVAANLMGASFLGATIAGVDLRGSNLHGADMARVRTDERVRLDDAILTRVRIHPRHVEGPA